MATSTPRVVRLGVLAALVTLGFAGGTTVAFAAPLSFASAVNYSVDPNPASIAVADLNGDGKPDLVVANESSSEASVLLGNGDGTFRLAGRFAVDGLALSVAVADLNGDNKPDLVVANTLSGGSNEVSVLLGNGDGSFRSAVNYRAGLGVDGAPGSVAVGDLNGDGKQDVVISNEGSTNISVLLGNGDGTLRPAVSYGVGRGGDGAPVAVAVSDLNRDGKPDIITANRRTNDVSVLLGIGNGTFQPAIDYPADVSPFGVAVSDLNGDGKPDLVVANELSNDVSVLIGNGDGSFQPPVNYGTGNFPITVAVGDLNGDGKPDLVVAHLVSTISPTFALSNDVSVLIGNGDGTFQPAVSYRVGSGLGPNSVTIADLNGDGRPDLAIADFFSSDIAVLLNTTPLGADLSIAQSGAPNPVVSGNRLTYTLTVTNKGPQNATGVAVTDSLPRNVHFTSVASTQGTCIRSATKPLPKDGTIACILGNLANGVSASITIVVTTTTPGQLSNTATVVGNETDPNPLNNSATATITVIGT
jgi:uncharacterized repeat protein (TIGR01451 family)